MHQRIIHSRHDEVGDATAGVAPAARQGVGSANHVLVEPAGAPHLARHEGPAQDANKETDDVESCGVLDQWRQPDRDAPDKKDQAENLAGADHVA